MPLICGDEHPTVVIPGAFPAEICAQLLLETDALTLGSAEILGSERLDWRASQTAFLPADHWAATAMAQLIAFANSSVGWNYDVSNPENPQFAAYGVGEHYDWHVDCCTRGDTVRKITAVLQLDETDDYAGGDLEFRRLEEPDERLDGPPELRDQGTVVVFPSYLVHRVTPVTRGTRRSLAMWMTGPRFR